MKITSNVHIINIWTHTHTHYIYLLKMCIFKYFWLQCLQWWWMVNWWMFVSLSTIRCAICKQEYDRGDRLITLPCGHKYHDECVKTWLKDNKVCYLFFFSDVGIIIIFFNADKFLKVKFKRVNFLTLLIRTTYIYIYIYMMDFGFF